MDRFTLAEENKLYDIAKGHLQKTDSNVLGSSMVSLAWRRSNRLIVVVWANRDLPSPDWGKDTHYYEQYNYHVALRVIYKNGQRYLRVVSHHEGWRNVWNKPFSCSICEYDFCHNA